MTARDYAAQFPSNYAASIQDALDMACSQWKEQVSPQELQNTIKQPRKYYDEYLPSNQ